MFEHEQPVGREQGAIDEGGEGAGGRAALDEIVGRVDEDQVECVEGDDLGGAALDGGGDEAAAGGDAEGGDVLRDGVLRLAAALDEDRRGGAAREGLEPQRAGAGVEIEHAGVGDDFGEAGEDNLAYAVLRGAQGVALGRLEVKATGGTGDDAERHGGVSRNDAACATKRRGKWPQRSAENAEEGD
jgi:hypothetical protein